ncbi:tripartite tricarboxylate transporter TctB family protein [Alkalihalobacillus deserti]|uniref:tripartite tricarboxylate transporter TctB family protein n=1 Tax=Alkalihalobacillus deserti TaxID=2879466 RepID=UPI001D13C84E|nr:tripartite tricarboxylate transporter TctB family protein [Alkalihalobacillus deserti]
MELTRSKINFIFLGLLIVVFVYTFIDALHFAEAARFFPLYVSASGIVLISLELIITFFKTKKQSHGDPTLFHPHLKLALRYIAWVGSFLLLIFIMGFKLAAVLFLLAFLKMESGFSWIKTVIAIACVMLFFIIVGDWYLNLNWPKNLLNL